MLAVVLSISQLILGDHGGDLTGLCVEHDLFSTIATSNDATRGIMVTSVSGGRAGVTPTGRVAPTETRKPVGAA